MNKYRLLPLLLLLLTIWRPTAAQEFTPDWQDIVPGYWERSALPQAGLATYYAAGLMESVQWRREVNGQIGGCAECVGAVALLRAGDIGRKVWLQPPGGEPVGPFLVVDCARRQDVMPLLARNWVVDISYELGQIWGMVRPLENVTVLEDPAEANVVTVVLDPSRLVPTRFYVPPGEVEISQPTATPTHDPAPVVVDAAQPTRWPTRLPGPLPGRPVLAPPTVDPSAPTPTATATPGPPPPTPLTPIVTTPTPIVTPETATPTPEMPDTNSENAMPTGTATATATTLPEVSLGRAGSALLVAAGTPAAAFGDVEGADLPVLPPLSPTSTRTPRPGLTPILPDVLPTPVPAGPVEEPLLFRLWRELWEAFNR